MWVFYLENNFFILIFVSMRNKYKYRFKTKEEFCKEYGRNWREYVPKKFPDFMDYLLGTEINLIDNDKIELDYFHSKLIDENGKLIANGFSLKTEREAIQYTRFLKISKDMLIEVIESPSYKPRTFIYE